jgi:hypothetical protein
MWYTPFRCFFDMLDEVPSRHRLAFTVYDFSFSPTDLTRLILNVALESVCVLSWIGTTTDEVIA